MAVSSSSRSSLLFWFVSRYLAAHLIMCGRLGQDGSSKQLPSVVHSFSVSVSISVSISAEMEEMQIRAIKRRMDWSFMITLWLCYG